MLRRKIFKVTGKVIRYTVAPASWYFIPIDTEMSAAIRMVRTKTVGFQFIPIEATVGRTTWRTTLFPTKAGQYLLALKAKVRQAESIREGVVLTVRLVLV